VDERWPHPSRAHAREVGADQSDPIPPGPIPVTPVPDLAPKPK
jgi:hypothetical protein